MRARRQTLRGGSTAEVLNPDRSRLANIRTRLTRSGAAELGGLLVRFESDHQLPRRGAHLRPLCGQRESSDVVGVDRGNLEEGLTAVLAELEDEVCGVRPRRTTA